MEAHEIISHVKPFTTIYPSMQGMEGVEVARIVNTENIHQKTHIKSHSRYKYSVEFVEGISNHSDGPPHRAHHPMPFFG